MQGICRLSRRWHQQFCHSPSFGPHRQCVKVLMPVRGLRQARRRINPATSLSHDERSHHNDLQHISPSQLLNHDNDDLVVREFEQHGSDATTRRSVEPDAALSSEVDQVWQQMQDIDRKLKMANRDPFDPQSEFMQQLPAEERDVLLKAFAAEGIEPHSTEDALDLAEIDRLVQQDEEDQEFNLDDEINDELTLSLRIPKADKALVSRFNKSLTAAKDDPEDLMKQLTLWKWYSRCHQRVPAFSRYMTNNIWNSVWESQERLQVKPQHLVILGQDMFAAGIEMSFQQRLTFIKALYVRKELTDALDVWEETNTLESFSKQARESIEFYSLGIQLQAALGEPGKAHKIAFTAIQRGIDPRILVQVIIAWAQSTIPGSAAKAWAVYLKMLALLDSKPAPEILEEISNAMLDSQHNSMALAVFRDMVTGMTGENTDMLATYQRSLGKIEKNANPEKVEQAINQVSLKMLLALPKQYQNKYFFASWIKKLLGERRTQAAAMVVDLMYERGIKPDAIHLNGLIGAWLRENTVQSRERAESLARDMIQIKTNQAKMLKPQSGMGRMEQLFRKTFSGGTPTQVEYLHIQRPIPAANQETFALLFDHYESRRRWDDIQQLLQTMIGPAQLKPNTFIMNKLLAVELEHAALERFWAIHQGLQQQVTPNIETFGLAWQATGLESRRGKNNSSSRHRQQFAVLMDWIESAPARVRRAAKNDFDEVFYNEITRSFCLRLDLAGTICAMHGMYNVFGYTPNETAIRLISAQVLRVLPKEENEGSRAGGRRRANSKLAPDQTKVKKIADIIETLELERKMELVDQGIVDPGILEDESSAEFRKLTLDVMTRFVKMMMQNLGKEAAHGTDKTLRDVAKVMHVDISKAFTGVTGPHEVEQTNNN